jgi:DNA-directed RNA polymerase subunit RPC12/RpoP
MWHVSHAEKTLKVLVDCPECGKQLRLAETHLGKQIRCPACAQRVTLPEFASSAKETPVSMQSATHRTDAASNRPNSYLAKCPGCDNKLKLKTTRMVGKRIRCPHCRQRFVVKPFDDLADETEFHQLADPFDGRDIVPALPPIQRAARTKKSRRRKGPSNRRRMVITACAGAVILGVLILLLGQPAVESTPQVRSSTAVNQASELKAPTRELGAPAAPKPPKRQSEPQDSGDAPSAASNPPAQTASVNEQAKRRPPDSQRSKDAVPSKTDSHRPTVNSSFDVIAPEGFQLINQTAKGQNGTWILQGSDIGAVTETILVRRQRNAKKTPSFLQSVSFAKLAAENSCGVPVGSAKIEKNMNVSFSLRGRRELISIGSGIPSVIYVKKKGSASSGIAVTCLSLSEHTKEYGVIEISGATVPKRHQTLSDVVTNLFDALTSDADERDAVHDGRARNKTARKTAATPKHRPQRSNSRVAVNPVRKPPIRKTNPAPNLSSQRNQSPSALLPPYRSVLRGRIKVRVRNPNSMGVLVGLRSGGKGKNFKVAARSVASANVPNGQYDVYFVYSDKPDALFQGDSFRLSGRGVEIKLVKIVGGNYGIRRVK